MTTLASRIAPKGTVARDLAAMWLTYAALFAYLDVPLQNAPLFAANVVLQSLLGGIVMTLLLRDVEPSLLLLCGPGLILGSTLSFTIFQILGRGAVGAVVTLGTAVAATLLFLRAQATYATVAPRWWLLGQLVGMATLAVTSEFSELVPAAIILFVLGYVFDPTRDYGDFARASALALGLVTVTAFAVLRQEYWWLITEDYLFLEVLSRHIATAGPFADWGVMNFSRYHWLSYGWSGMLSQLSGEPQPFVTLTRVTPIVYSISMASSLALITTRLVSKKIGPSILVPVWAVIAVGAFDWTGTSTGGVYATLTALLAVAVLSRFSNVSSMVLATSFAMVAVLTKVSAVIGVILLSVTLSIDLAARKLATGRQLFGIWMVSAAISLPILAGTLLILSQLVGEFSLSRINTGLGQLSWFGRDFASLALIMRQLWLWIAVVYLMIHFHYQRRCIDVQPRWILSTAATSLVAGLLCELTISGRANHTQYFSSPLYFLSSLSFLLISRVKQNDDSLSVRTYWITASWLVLVGLSWNFLNLSGLFWDTLSRVASNEPSLKLELLKFVTTNGNVAVAAITGMILATSKKSQKTHVFSAFMTSLVLLSMINAITVTRLDLPRMRTSSEIDSNLGRSDVREVAKWLKQNSMPTDLIATNFALDNDASLSSYSLPLWSNREFLVIAPRLRGDRTNRQAVAVRESRAFANTPNMESCRAMQANGVSWFVVDISKTMQRDWSVCASPSITIYGFIILRLHPTMNLAP